MKALWITAAAVTFALLVNDSRVNADQSDGCTRNCDAGRTACVQSAGTNAGGATVLQQAACDARHAQCVDRCRNLPPSAPQPH